MDGSQFMIVDKLYMFMNLKYMLSQAKYESIWFEKTSRARRGVFLCVQKNRYDTIKKGDNCHGRI